MTIGSHAIRPGVGRKRHWFLCRPSYLLRRETVPFLLIKPAGLPLSTSNLCICTILILLSASGFAVGLSAVSMLQFVFVNSAPAPPVGHHRGHSFRLWWKELRCQTWRRKPRRTAAAWLWSTRK